MEILKLHTTLSISTLYLIILSSCPCGSKCRDRMMEYEDKDIFWIHSCFKCDNFIFGDNVVVMKLFEKSFQIFEKLKMIEQNNKSSHGLNPDENLSTSTTINLFQQKNTKSLEKENSSKHQNVLDENQKKSGIKTYKRMKKADRRCWNILSSKVNRFSIPILSTLQNEKLIPTKSFIRPYNCSHLLKDFQKNKRKIKQHFDQIKNVNDSYSRNETESNFYNSHMQFNKKNSKIKIKRNSNKKNEIKIKENKIPKTAENKVAVNDSADVFLSNNKELNPLSPFRYLYFNRRFLVINSDDDTQKSDNEPQDDDNYESKDHFMKLLCLSLNVEESRCLRWSTCCLHAHQCCQRMQLEDQLMQNNHVNKFEISLNNGNRNNLQSYNTSFNQKTSKKCATTWDGFACWASQKGVSIVKQSCPVFLGNISPQS